jgi:hypothetical protein
MVLVAATFIVGARRCSLDIHDHSILDIDQVVQSIAELNTLVGFGWPGRLWGLMARLL